MSGGFDLGIEGGELVTPRGRGRLHVYISDGAVAALSAERVPAAEVVDASGLLVTPGMVDAHVHFMDPADPSREDFPTATAAALRSGETTVIEHTHARGVRKSVWWSRALRRWLVVVESASSGFWWRESAFGLVTGVSVVSACARGGGAACAVA